MFTYFTIYISAQQSAQVEPVIGTSGVEPTVTLTYANVLKSPVQGMPTNIILTINYISTGPKCQKETYEIKQ
jgi:hypothetical protein